METETISDIYKVKTAKFEGPFGLLLHLVEDKKLYINDLSLAQVTDDFLNYVNNLRNMNPTEVSSFIVVAATLILIKSKSLLPSLVLTKEEEGDISNLEDRLKLYDLYFSLSSHIKNNFGKNIIFSANESKNTNVFFVPDNQISKESMMINIQSILNKIPKKISLPEVEVKKVVSIEEMIDNLTERITNSFKMNFKEFAGSSKTKEEKVFVIVSFLAILELVRSGIIDAIQDSNFKDILIEKTEPEVSLD